MGKFYAHLSIEERTMIQTQLAMGVKAAAIAKGLGRCASTLSRELRRNGWVSPKARRGPGRPALAGGYRAEVAHERARDCIVTPRVIRRLYPGSPLWDEVNALFETPLLARADRWHTRTGACPNSVVASFSRNHLHRDLRHAAWRTANAGHWVVAVWSCQAPSANAWRRPATQSTARPTLAEAIEHVLKTRRGAHAGSVMARQLHAEVQQAGYRFGGNKVENQMNYLHKTLRQNSTRFKRAADGGLSIA